jgi:hypothetical protein
MSRTTLGSRFGIHRWRPRFHLLSTGLVALPAALAITGLTAARPSLAQKLPVKVPLVHNVVPAPVAGQTQILTYHNDNQRTGVNPYENILTPTVVKQGFGKLFSHVVDGSIYGQPLFVSGLTISNPYSGESSVHKGVVFVTTANNSVYAFDADSATGANAGPLWYINFNFLPQGIGPVPGDAIIDLNGIPQTDIQPVIGIIGTPVIDPVGGTMYVLVRTQEYNDFVHRLHAIDITTGLEKPNSPVNVYDTITGNEPSVPGVGDGTDGNGNVVFDPLFENQRAALTLSPDGSTLYIAYDGTDYIAPYHGWLLAYNTANLTLSKLFNTSPNAEYSYVPNDPPVGGGFGMSGGGLALDASGNIFAATSLGAFDANAPTGFNTEYGESILNINPTDLTVKDYFTPYNYAELNASGADLGAGGVVVLPDSAAVTDPNHVTHTHLLAAAGNEGKFYLLDRDNLGKIGSSADTGALYTRRNSLGQQYGTPAYFNGQLFYHAAGDVLRTFQLTKSYPYITDTTPANSTSPVYDFPGAIPSISANGTASGIVWEIQPYQLPLSNPNQGDNQTAPTLAVLRAYDATATGTPIWSSLDAGGRDTGPNYIKYSVPTVANGKVFVGGDGMLTVYGQVANTVPAKGVHYVISGPNVMAGIVPSYAGLPDNYWMEGWSGLLLASAPVLTANVKYDFSVTAIGVDGKPISTNHTARLYVQNGLSKTPVTTVRFNNQSNTTFTTYFTTPGTLVLVDDSGNSSFVPIQVGGQAPFGFDHYVLRAPQAVHDGKLSTILLTGNTASGGIVPLPADVLTVYDTLPTGTQPYDIDTTNPASFGILPADPSGFIDPIEIPQSVTTTGFSYEFQWGFGNFTQLGFPAPDPNYFGFFQTTGGALAAGIPVRLHGVGKHVIIVTEGTGPFLDPAAKPPFLGGPASQPTNIILNGGATATAIVNVVP